MLVFIFNLCLTNYKDYLSMFHLYVFRDHARTGLDAFIVKDNVKLAMAHMPILNSKPYINSMSIYHLDRLYI